MIDFLKFVFTCLLYNYGSNVPKQINLHTPSQEKTSRRHFAPHKYGIMENIVS